MSDRARGSNQGSQGKRFKPHARTDAGASRGAARQSLHLRQGSAHSGSRFDGTAYTSAPRSGYVAGQAPTPRYVPRQDNPYAHGSSRGAVGYNATAHIPNGGRHRQKAKRGRGRGPLAGIIVVGVIALVALLFVLNPPIYTVRVNGVDHLANWGTTLQSAVSEGWASPTAGNLVAVDGSVITEGGGNAFVAKFGGEETSDGSRHLTRGMDVTIEDGTDVEEEYTTETKEIEPSVAGGTDQNYWSGSIHVYSDGEAGEEEVRTGKVSGKTATKVTKKAKDAGYSVYTVDTGDEKVVALTFDDGPWPTTTAEILDILKENDAKATFFEIGNQVAENADVVKRIHNEGHQLATHTWDHAAGSGQGVNLTYMTAAEQVEEVDKGFQAIEDVIGESVTRVFRAPGGNYTGDIITNLKDHVTAEIGWNVDTEDWSKPGADAIAQAIESAQPGDVILMHDGGGDRSQTVEALRTALPVLKEKGYKFVTIDELMAMDQSDGSDSSES